MVNRINRDTAHNSPQQNNSVSISEGGYPPKHLRSISNQFTDISGVDDVIASLANAHENRRARQVTEWEKMPRQYVH
jgi:hypothetical protein